VYTSCKCLLVIAAVFVSECKLKSRLSVQVGLHDGTIAVFNVSIISGEPVLDSWSVSVNSVVLFMLIAYMSQSYRTIFLFYLVIVLCVGLGYYGKK